MSIDRQRVAAVAKLEEMGFTFKDGQWIKAEADNFSSVVAGTEWLQRSLKLAGIDRGAYAVCLHSRDDLEHLRGLMLASEGFKSAQAIKAALTAPGEVTISGVHFMHELPF